MNDPSDLNATTFWRICSSSHECHCDYRLTIYNCIESGPFYNITLVGLVWSSVVSAVGIFLLAWRVLVQKQRLFEIRHKLPRPKPIESMCLFGIVFNLVRIIHAAVILTDVGQSPILRLFLFDQCWAFAFSAFTCYVFGVAQTLLNSNRVLYDAWLSSPSKVDAICMISTVLPYIFMNVGAIGSGYYAWKKDVDMAYVLLRVGYYCAMVYTFVLGVLIIYAGRRLTGLISDPVLLHSNIRITTTKLQASSFKVKVTMACGSFCLLSMGLIACVYASTRIPITTNYILAMLFSSFISFVGPGVTSIIMLALFLSPEMISGLAILSLSPDDDEEPQEYPRFEFNLNNTSQQMQQQNQESSIAFNGCTIWNNISLLSKREQGLPTTASSSPSSSSTKLVRTQSTSSKSPDNSAIQSTLSSDTNNFASWQHFSARAIIEMHEKEGHS
ncbi:hypothetical protein [Absidia glauca]|uniref:G-protein coupled receptors family 1 profile domain-containing protein n=1 Tax=Absidia glauca TaxID=4829 RepID=A0A168QRX7_ABSGL|nr:hypothetical protein [Absidia glauca]